MPSSPVWSASSPENSGFTGVWRLLRPELIPEKRRIALLGAIVLISTAISYLSPWLQRKCINALEIRVWEPAVLFAAAVFSAIAAARLLDAAETYLVNILNTRIGLSLKRRMLGSLLGLSAASISRLGSGYIAGRLLNDLDTSSYLYSGVLCSGVRNALKIIGGFCFIALFDWRIAAGLLPALACYWPVAALFRRRQYQLALEVCERRAESNRTIYDALRNITLVKAGTAEQQANDRFHSELNSIEQLQLRRFKLDNLFRAALLLLPGICYAGVAALGIHMILAERWTLGEFWALNCYLSYLFNPLQALCASTVRVQQAVAAAGRLLQLQRLMPEPGGGSRKADRLTGKITIRRLNFSYDAATPVFRDFSLEISPGEKVVITGESGCGKSTLAALLLSFYRPTSGEILFDGHPQHEYELATLRRRIGYLSQVTEFFNGTIRDNLSSGLDRAPDDAELLQALRTAGADELLRHLPDGLASRIFEGGANFSVGERLRLALARELLRDSDIIMFDESTANLDPVHEQQLLDVIDRHFSTKTILLISHRESSIARFSRRIHLEKLRERS